jgi:hypothetical protein
LKDQSITEKPSRRRCPGFPSSALNPRRNTICLLTVELCNVPNDIGSSAIPPELLFRPANGMQCTFDSQRLGRALHPAALAVWLAAIARRNAASSSSLSALFTSQVQFRGT